MANSSDWLSALLDKAQDAAPSAESLGWVEALARSDGFVEGLPFARANEAPADCAKAPPAKPEPERNLEPDVLPPEPQPDPIAEAYARGEAAGRAAERAAANAEAQALGSQHLALRQTFRALDQAAMDALASDLAETVIALCAQTLDDYAPDADALNARCVEAAKRLGGGAKGAVLHLHPDDLALLEEDALEVWEVARDPAVGRGGLRLVTPDGCVSDTPSDWRRAIATAIRG